MCANLHTINDIRALKQIRSSVSSDKVRTVVRALVNSRLDYASSVPYDTSAANISRQQRVQNALERMVTYTKRAEHIHPIVDQLPHWVQGGYTRVYVTTFPAYLLPAVSNYIPTRYLLTSSQLLLSKPCCKNRNGNTSFNQAAPSVWNTPSLPVEIRVSETARQ